jgi:hypothetical protein
MQTYWCCEKNSIVNWINNGVDFNPALVSYIKVECDQWREGECIQIRKAGKIGLFLLHLVWLHPVTAGITMETPIA